MTIYIVRFDFDVDDMRQIWGVVACIDMVVTVGLGACSGDLGATLMLRLMYLLRRYTQARLRFATSYGREGSKKLYCIANRALFVRIVLLLCMFTCQAFMSGELTTSSEHAKQRQDLYVI